MVGVMRVWMKMGTAAIYQDQQVRQHTRRLSMSWVRWEMIISRISRGRLVEEDGCETKFLGETSLAGTPWTESWGRLVAENWCETEVPNG